MLAHLGPILCWPMLTHLRPQESKNGNSKKHRKTREFLMVRGGGVVGGRGGGPSLLRGGGNCRTAMPRPAPGPAGSWPDRRCPPCPPTHPQTTLRRLKSLQFTVYFACGVKKHRFLRCFGPFGGKEFHLGDDVAKPRFLRGFGLQEGAGAAKLAS